MSTTSTHHTREVPIDSLVIDPRFADLFLEEPATIRRISADMKRNGFDPYRPIDVWKDGAGRGKHVVLEGHQRLAAAKLAGLETVRIAYRHFAADSKALTWAAEQQTNRRNSSREANCLSILRALERNGQLAGTRAELAERYGFGDATVGRALQVLRRGTESEITAVREGAWSLKTAYEKILARERADSEVVKEPKAEPRATDDLDEDLDGEVLPDDEDVPEELAHARDLMHSIQTRIDRLDDVLGVQHAADAIDDVKAGRADNAMHELAGLTEDMAQALQALKETS